jgi:anti-sigma regulatory factor (Ser/Thr protein kinase)
MPELPGWRVSAYYQPAWEVGGDFYDFIPLPDNKLAIVVGDVTDKGMPSALVMASTRSLVRASAERDPSPAAVLAAANRSLVEDIPPRMFVTCFYLLLDPSTGEICYANAGHDLPYRRRNGSVSELRATGMPLGLMPDMSYEEVHSVLEEGETIVFYSDGLVEAHDPQGDMLGFPRVGDLISRSREDGPALIGRLLDELALFTGPGWLQEDDVTLVTLARTGDELSPDEGTGAESNERDEEELDRFRLPSAPGNEVHAIERVVSAIQECRLAAPVLDRLRTAVGEAVMNAMEHGNRYREDLPVEVSVSLASDRLIVRVFDAGTEPPPINDAEPNIDAKLEGRDSPRGWGLFLMRSMVDDVRVHSGPSGKTTELILNLENRDDGGSGV